MSLQKLYCRHRHGNVFTRLKFKSSKQTKIGVTKKILKT